ncbi:pinin-like [Actinia tenebrosa]|uniref:Pinin-like n=1 Tax=Actinia tenebrosa TaxID=6105 RepID=A0A6P8IPA5_ACTTE|nr:pinin-like [Actinia tenebrosa]
MRQNLVYVFTKFCKNLQSPFREILDTCLEFNLAGFQKRVNNNQTDHKTKTSRTLQFSRKGSHSKISVQNVSDGTTNICKESYAMYTTERSEHTQVKRVRFVDPEAIVRKIMLRRLLSLRPASKNDSKQDKAESTSISNEVDKNSKTCAVEETRTKTEICCKVKNVEETLDVADNKLVIEEVSRKEQLINSKEEKNEDVTKTKDTDEEELKKNTNVSEESEEEKEKKDDEKETSTAEEGESSTESLPESEVDSNAESCHSEFRSDPEGKDSGIEKGESPNLLHQDINDEDEVEAMSEDDEAIPEKPKQDALISVLKNSRLAAKTTLQVMSPAITKKRFAKRGKIPRRLAKENSGFDSEQSNDSSPEKRYRGKKNMTVSYLSYPQRYVRSSLAVEARLSQWRKETSVVEGRDSTATRKLKQTARNTLRNSMDQKREKFKGKNVNFSESRRASESSDTSSDEDVNQMSVRKIYNSKNALRRRIENLEGKLQSMAVQKEGLENLVFIMNVWAKELSAVERTKLGVPYIRSIKQVLKRHHQSLNSRTSDFGELLALLGRSKIPCFDDIHKMVKQLNKNITSIVQDRKKYSSRHIEDLRQIQGKIIGICSAVKAVYYEE